MIAYSQNLIHKWYMGYYQKMDESKNQKVLWNAEQMQVMVVPLGSSSINLYIPFPTSPMY